MMKRWQIATVLSIVGLITMFVGWAWWNQLGPFRDKEYLPKETQDPLAGVEYIDTSVEFQEFVQFYDPTHWVEGAKGYPDWNREKIPSLAPYIPSNTPRKGDLPLTKTEAKKLSELRQDFEQFATEVIIAEGFRPLPYMTAQRRTIEAISRVHMFTLIKTYKRNNLVVFQIRTTLHCDIRAQFKKPTLLDVELADYESVVYVVEEKDALRAIKDVLQKNMQSILRENPDYYSPSVRSRIVRPYNSQSGLRINEGEQ